jgi:hypothetical protein
MTKLEFIAWSVFCCCAGQFVTWLRYRKDREKLQAIEEWHIRLVEERFGNR